MAPTLPLAVLAWLAAAPPSPRGEPRCRPSTEALEREAQEADAFSAQARAAALVKRGLTPVELPLQSVDLAALAPGTVERGPDGKDYVVQGHAETPSDALPDLTFVQAKEGGLYVVDFEPRYLVDRNIVVCGCGSPGSGAFMPQTFAYQLPKDRPLKGHLRVKYDAKRVTLNSTNLMDDGSPCARAP